MLDTSKVVFNGNALSAILKAFLSENLAYKMIQEGLGVQDIVPDKMYPIDGFLKPLFAIEKKIGALVLNKVGTKMMESAAWPPNIKTLEDVLKSINVAYKMNHKPNDAKNIGEYIYSKLEDKKYTITATNPYPCDFDLGIIQGAVKKFAPTAIVKHVSGSCRKNGDMKCIYEIKV